MSFDSSRSANSGGKSKRSYSNPSRNSNDRNTTENKKRKTNQKTLGMAWGANSPSSSRSSFRSSPFSDFGSYMVVKNRKLQDQFDAEASSSSHSGSTFVQPIFRGVSIFVDGFTIPSSQELRGYMLKFGGRFENYFSRRRVTHIICSNLPDSKIKNLRSFSRGLPVVKPTWVLDSVAANKLLNWVPYQLDQLANETSNQPKLSAFFAMKGNLVEKGAAGHAICQVEEDTGDFPCKDENSGYIIPCEVQEFLKCTGQSGGKVDSHMQENSTEGINGELTCSRGKSCENSTEEINEELTCSRGKSCDMKMAESNNVAAEDNLNVKVETQRPPCQSSASASSYCSENQNARGLTGPMPGPSNSSHSTLGDPNFVDNYFKNSRLHFIGTWRNRYRKRFPSLSFGLKSTNPNQYASGSQTTAIIHVDMDCFFVAVVIRDRPELQVKPVAVCHSDSPRGTAEISSANYPAREYGVRAGIFVRDAKALCPHLVIVPYNFEAYEEVADKFYNILHKHCNKVQAVSCDEAFLEAAESDKEDPERLASTIRREIFDATGCTASAGVAGNMLMARLATRIAKPDGQCYIPAEEVNDYLIQLPIKMLPGVGHVLEQKLKRQKIETCGQLRMISKETLQKDFGSRTGDMLWNYSRGIDNRLVGVFQESKSLGAEVNWGVRFNNLEDSRAFVSNLCKEVSLRLQGCGVQGRAFTLKIKKRRKDAEEPSKFMGCGDCENLSHSMTVPVPTDDVEVLQRIARQLFGSFSIDVKDIRGIGLQVSKLESADFAKKGQGRNSLQTWLACASSNGRQCKINDQPKERDGIGCQEESIDGMDGGLCSDSVPKSVHNGSSSSTAEACLNQLSAVPPLSHLDLGVLECLPPELFSEMNEVYGGKLIDLISRNKSKIGNINSQCARPLGAIDEGVVHHSEVNSLTSRPEGKEEKQNAVQEIGPAYTSRPESFDVVDPPSVHPKVDLMPSSLSQVDISVLQQLPEELRVDILELLPVHRQAERSTNAALGIANTEDRVRSIDSLLNSNLWIGDPPHWVGKFKASNCLILNFLADVYYRVGSGKNFSSILQHTISELQFLPGAVCDSSDEVICSLCELLKQYIKLKLESDIEEIYVCFRLFRRIMELLFSGWACRTSPAGSSIFLLVSVKLFKFDQTSDPAAETTGGYLGGITFGPRLEFNIVT